MLHHRLDPDFIDQPCRRTQPDDARRIDCARLEAFRKFYCRIQLF